MSLLDLLILLVAAVIFFFAHTPLSLTVIFTLVALVIVRVARGERI